MAVVTNVPLLQSVFIPDFTALTAYNRIRWYRSRTGADGAFAAITAAAAAPAVLTATPGPYALNGKTLSLRVSGTTRTHTFVAADPVSAATAAAELGMTGVTGADVAGTLTLSSTATGITATLEVLESAAAPYLGLVVNSGAHGLAADSVLVAPGTHAYELTDAQGDATWWYATEYRSSTGPAVSARSIPFLSRAPGATPVGTLLNCFIRLTDPSGNPVVGSRLTVHNVFVPDRVTSGTTSWGVFRNYVEAHTDATGYAAIQLLRGTTVDINIAGTGYTRRITVPTDVAIDSLDLLDPDLSTTDEFGIQVPNIPFAIRMS